VVVGIILTLSLTTNVLAPIGQASKAIESKTKQVLGIQPAPAPVPEIGYGIAAGSSLTQLSDTELNARMVGMQKLGVTWVRFDIDWSIVQPQASGQYSWSLYDKIVASANAHGLKVLGILTYTPAWARADGCDASQCAPSDPSVFARFAAAAANRYKSQNVHAWEIWNEPNNPQYWRPATNVSRYVTLLKQSYAALHSADGNAIVLSGGLSPQADSDTSLSPVSFVKQLYVNGAKGYFDALSDHPYTFPLSPSSSADHAWNQMAATGNSLRSLMVSNGDSAKKIWITEFGSPTGGPGAVATPALTNLDQHPYVVSEAQQANILTGALQLYKTYDWVGPFMYYSYEDAGTTTDTNENFFGLVNTTGRQKPAYQIYYDAIHK
jgi:hypothetical protein